MKKFFIILIVLAFVYSVSGQTATQNVKAEDSAVAKSYVKYGGVIAGWGEGATWRILRADSSGILFITEAIWDVSCSDTQLVHVYATRDTFAFGATYEHFTISCDNVDKAFWFMNTDSTFCERIPAGGIGSYSAEADSIVVWVESGTANVTITKRNRERK